MIKLPIGVRLIALSIGAAGCDAAVTSVGSWSPSLQRNFYLEAESGELSGGFTVMSDPSTSGGQFIAPPSTPSVDAPGPARARYSFMIANPGSYIVWGRIHSPDAIHNTFWIQLDGGTIYKWRITTGDVWWWDRFHDDTDYGHPLKFDLEPGLHELAIANCAEGNGLDRLYVTAESDTPPGNDTPCNPPHSVELDGGCVRSCGSQGGNGCGTVQCAGRPALSAYDCDICCTVPGDGG